MWERVPPVENLSPGYRQVIGFWQHVVEKRVNLTLKTDVTTTSRARSLIVYTPSGYVGVYFPPMWAAKPFAGADPTDQEAREVLRGSWATSARSLSIPGRCSITFWAA